MDEILEHTLKKWEIQYGYLNVKTHPEWREFFKSVIHKNFTLNVFGEEQLERKVDTQNRIFVGRAALRNLKAGETIIILRDEEGNFHVRKK